MTKGSRSSITRWDVDCPPLDNVREVGFDNRVAKDPTRFHLEEATRVVSSWPQEHRAMLGPPPNVVIKRVGHPEERVFFIDASGRDSYRASVPVIEEAILYLQNQVDVLRDYLRNGCNNNTHEWKK